MNLFIDTSSSYIILSLFNDKEVCSSSIITTNRNQSETFIAQLDYFLNNNDIALTQISNFFFGQGPGSFTGIRVGLSFAKALRCSGYKNVYAINSLYLLLDYNRDSAALIDARSDKSYYVSYYNKKISTAMIYRNADLDIKSCNTYDSHVDFIALNVIKIVALGLYDDRLDGLYLKEAF